MWLVSLPLNVQASKKKRFSLNLNQYRNTHFHLLSAAKNNYSDVVKKILKKLGLPYLNQVKLVFTVYPATKVLLDTSNICCIVEKFFCDALVSSRVIPDDNYNHVIETTYKYGSVDRINPRVDVQIIPFTENPKGTSIMKIILTQDEVLSALQDHISNLVQISEDTDMTLELLEDGSVEVILTKDDEDNEAPVAKESSTPPTAKKTTRRRRRTKAQIEADEKAAKEAEVSDTQVELPLDEEPEKEKEAAPDVSGPSSLFPEDDDDEEEDNDESPVVEAHDLFKDH